MSQYYPYPHPLNDLDAAERAAWQRGDYREAEILAELCDREDWTPPGDLAAETERADAAIESEREAREKTGSLATQLDKAHELIGNAVSLVQAAKTVSGRAGILLELQNALDALEVGS